MLSNKKVVVIAACIVLAVVLLSTTHGAFRLKPTPDEFAVYAVVLAHLSQEWGSRLVLADRTSQLEALRGNRWEPAELRPYPPSKAAPPEQFVDFCGALCGHDFMGKNLRAWSLKPSPNGTFPFPVVSSDLVVGSNRIRVVKVTRCGFDLWRRRAVLSYSFDGSSVGSVQEPGAVCAGGGDVFLENVNGSWHVTRECDHGLICRQIMSANNKKIPSDPYRP